MKCYSCKTNEASIDKKFGVLPCKECQSRESQLEKPGTIPEFTSESIKEQRKEFKKDYLPFHNRGHLDKGAIERYGVAKVKEHGFTDDEIKKAKYTWNSESYYKDH